MTNLAEPDSSSYLETSKIKINKLDSLLQVIKIVNSSLDLEEVLNHVMDQIINLSNAERGFLMLIGESGQLEFKAARNMDKKTIEASAFDISRTIVKQVTESAQPVITDNAQRDPRFTGMESIVAKNLRSILCIPLKVKDKLTGVIYVDNRLISGIFEEHDKDLLMAFGSQAAISIENARLHAQEIEQRLKKHELETATQIQQSFLPDTPPAHSGWDIKAFWLPKGEVAGDFYDFYKLPDGRIAVIIADVSDKGVPAALVMALCLTVLRFGMDLNLSPAKLMSHTNQVLMNYQQSGMFATTFVGYLDLDSKHLEYACAGHNSPIIYRHQNSCCETLETTGIPLGIMENSNYKEKSVSLSANDVLVLYTDGITEVFNSSEELFEEKRLQKLIIEHASSNSQTLIDQIIKTVNKFSHSADFHDDATLIAIKPAHN